MCRSKSRWPLEGMLQNVIKIFGKQVVIKHYYITLCRGTMGDSILLRLWDSGRHGMLHLPPSCPLSPQGILALWRKWPNFRTHTPIVLQNNTHCHIAVPVRALFTWWELLKHLPYSPDMNPGDFDPIGKLKEPMWGKHFHSRGNKSLSSRLLVCSHQ